MGEITVSIIVPVYNVSRYLKRCVDSILAQKYTHFEVILVDDGSIDDSGMICDAYEKKDARVRVLHKKNGGLSSARNAGMEIAQGAFFLFVDSDDFISEEMLRVMTYEMFSENADLVICGYEKREQSEAAVCIGTSKPLERICCDSEHAMSMLVSNQFDFMVPSWNKLYKRSLFDNKRYPEGKLHEDEFLIHHVLHQARKIVIISDPLYRYMIGGLTITNSAYKPSRLDAIEAYIDRIHFLRIHGYDSLSYAEIEHLYLCINNSLGRIDHYDDFSRRLDALKQELRRDIYPQVFTQKVSLRTKIFAALFDLSPRIFWRLRKRWIRKK